MASIFFSLSMAKIFFIGKGVSLHSSLQFQTVGQADRTCTPLQIHRRRNSFLTLRSLLSLPTNCKSSEKNKNKERVLLFNRALGFIEVLLRV